MNFDNTQQKNHLEPLSNKSNWELNHPKSPPKSCKLKPKLRLCGWNQIPF